MKKKKKFPSLKQQRERHLARLMKRVRRAVAQAGGRARWAGTTPEARSEAMRALALARHGKGKGDAGSTS